MVNQSAQTAGLRLSKERGEKRCRAEIVTETAAGLRLSKERGKKRCRADCEHWQERGNKRRRVEIVTETAVICVKLRDGRIVMVADGKTTAETNAKIGSEQYEKIKKLMDSGIYMSFTGDVEDAESVLKYVNKNHIDAFVDVEEMAVFIRDALNGHRIKTRGKSIEKIDMVIGGRGTNGVGNLFYIGMEEKYMCDYVEVSYFTLGSGLLEPDLDKLPQDIRDLFATLDVTDVIENEVVAYCFQAIDTVAEKDWSVGGISRAVCIRQGGYTRRTVVKPRFKNLAGLGTVEIYHAVKLCDVDMDGDGVHVI